MKNQKEIEIDSTLCCEWWPRHCTKILFATSKDIERETPRILL